MTEKFPVCLHGETKGGGGMKSLCFQLSPRFQNGSEVNRMQKSELLSPILRDTGITDFEAYAISREAGVFDFGKIHNL
ncbi:hypothetical protein HRED_03634 [Candidatus Haloredivivus sp. G17]|nr:hypothetical protein HRED_03634 [Candidatus Haloredivivus sp. G17]